MSNLYTVTFILDYETIITTVAATHEHDAVCEAIERLNTDLLIPRRALRRASIEIEQVLEDVAL